MKYKLIPVISAILSLGILCSCEFRNEPQPVQYKAPEVEFTMPSEVIDAKVGDPVPFSAKVVAGDKVSTGWYINDVLTSSSQSFKYVFEEAGRYTVRFEARNGAGVVSRDYTVNVSDILSIALSTGDSTRVVRLQLEYLKIAAVVDYGKDVEHEWSVDGEVLCNEAFFGTFRLAEARVYNVHYRGSNASGSFSKDVEISVIERPLEIEFSNTDEIIAMLAGRTLSITATALFGGTGLQQTWYLDGEPAGTAAVFSHYFAAGGEYSLRYEAVNAKGETVTRNWKVNVTSTGRLFDDFEADAIGSWFNLGENQPGIELVENPHKDGINTSDKLLHVEGSQDAVRQGLRCLRILRDTLPRVSWQEQVLSEGGLRRNEVSFHHSSEVQRRVGAPRVQAARGNHLRQHQEHRLPNDAQRGRIQHLRRKRGCGREQQDRLYR